MNFYLTGEYYRERGLKVIFDTSWFDSCGKRILTEYKYIVLRWMLCAASLFCVMSAMGDNPRHVRLEELQVKPKKEKYSKKDNPAVDFVRRLMQTRPSGLGKRVRSMATSLS